MKKKILIADDVETTRLILKRMLLKLSDSWVIEEARDGEEALDSYFHFQPDYVLLDVELPELDGWEILQCIREIDKETTIIMVTASNEPDDVLRAKELGANGFVCKPFDTAEFADALDYTNPTIQLQSA